VPTPLTAPADPETETETESDGDADRGRGPGPELLGWWELTRRDLPWRRTRDPWAVLVSEVMLQQTQVDRVIPRWHCFLDRFPTIVACAAAGPGAVVEEWAGLGYNRRAVSLHRCAVAVTDAHRGALPADLRELMALPGIGPYTARAVLAFAFEVDVAVVDTNVGRILARTSGRTLSPVEAQSLADDLVPLGKGWAWNQAMLDLGAMVCRKRAPVCDRCPVAATCRWATSGRRGTDPAVGSHAVSRAQSRFEGSFRQVRSKLLDGVRRAGRLAPSEWPDACGGLAPALAERAALALVADGLAEIGDDGWLRLPA
jgi:A/G-specific adenine glycosylase